VGQQADDGGLAQNHRKLSGPSSKQGDGHVFSGFAIFGKETVVMTTVEIWQ
jgi:hypothetical protein